MGEEEGEEEGEYAQDMNGQWFLFPKRRRMGDPRVGDGEKVDMLVQSMGQLRSVVETSMASVRRLEVAFENPKDGQHIYYPRKKMKR